MIKHSVIDNHFDINITSSYFLSIRLMLDGFSFCVLDPVSNEYIQFCDISLEKDQNLFECLSSELSNNDLLIYPYQKVFILYHSEKCTLIPQAIFDQSKAEEYLDFGHQLTSPYESLIFCNKIKMADSWCVFNFPTNIHELLKKYYQDARYFSHITPFIEASLLNTSIGSNNNHVHINIRNPKFDIIVTSGNNLQLQNMFEYHNYQDFLYFTLFVFEQLKLDTHLTKVFLSGNINKSDELYALLKKYIKQIEINKETKHFKFSDVFKNIPMQKHLNLFNTPLCV